MLYWKLTYHCIVRRLLLIGINTINGIAVPAFNFLIVIIGVRFFGKSDWASLINVFIWVHLIVFLFGWGNRDYLLRAYSENPAAIYSKFFSNLCSRALLLPLSLVLFGFFPFYIALWAILFVVLNFIYTALNTLIIYHQNFKSQLIAETVSFGVIASALFYIEHFQLQTFLKLFVLATFIKIIVLAFSLNLFSVKFDVKISSKEYVLGFPFFILGLSGWLISKTDIYFVDYYLDKPQLSEYQLLITAFLMLQALAGFFIIPFTKHIYRVSDVILKKMRYKLYLASIPVTGIGGFLIWVVMEYFVKLGFTFEYYVLGVLIALPCYFYTLNVFKLLKNYQEKMILKISVFAFCINTILILLLIKPYEIFGVLLSVAITQWFILILFKLMQRYND